MTINISLSKNVLDNYPTDLFLTKDELVTILTTYHSDVQNKKTSPAFIAGHFCGTQRITDNLQSRTLITLDIDHCNTDLNDLEGILEESLNEYGYCAYSTASHTPNKPKIRIVLFLENEISVASYKTVATNFINSISKLKPYIDITASTTPCQLMFLPFKSSKEYTPWYKIHSGENVKAELFMQPTSKNQYVQNMHNVANKVPLSDILEPFDDFDKTVKSTPLNLSTSDIIAHLKLYPKKSCSYDEWLEVGECLHHQFKGSDEGKNIWLQWSLKHKKSDNNIDNIPYKWTTFKTDRAKVKTFASIIKKAASYKAKIVLLDSIKPLCKSKWVHTKGKNLNPISSKDNFRILLYEYNIDVYYDEILKDVFTSVANKIALNNNSALTNIRLLCELNGLKVSLANETINMFAAENTINSWKDLILSSSNAKTNNLELFYASITVEPQYEHLKRVYIKKWLMQMLHMTCLNDGERPKSARMVLVFQGKQGIGKTSWFRSLVPDEYSKYALEGHTLHVDNHMNVLTCLQHVFVELGELAATFRKSDTEQLKSFITNTVDELNEKYTVKPVKYRRRTVFFGSVNDEKFLQDQTGNSRFLVLPVLKCDARHGINMLDLYAELLEEIKDTPDYDLDQSELELQTTINNEFESVNSLKESFEEYFDITKRSDEIMNATKVLLELGFNISSIRKNHSNEMATILRGYGFKESTNPRGWCMPPLKLKRDIFNEE